MLNVRIPFVRPRDEFPKLFLFVINSKNYTEASGLSVVRLSSAVEVVSRELKASDSGIEIALALPAFGLGLISQRFPDLSVFAQHIDNVGSGSTTGYLAPEIAKSFGARGSILNHSEHRLAEPEIEKGVGMLRSLGMKSIVCAKDQKEVGRFTALDPDFVAVEPPELIGSGTAVSKAKPELISNSKKELENHLTHGSKTGLLCGAGIVEAADVKRAVELGAQGILIASGVIKANDWVSKIRSLASGFIS